MVQSDILAKINSPQLSVFVIWLPIMGADSYQHAQQAQALLPDARARHLWDGRLALGQGYRRILPLGAECKFAWDVYLLYRPGGNRFRYTLLGNSKKGWTPPAPDFWMHQLNCMTREQYFDSKVLRENIEALLTGNLAAR